MSKCRLAVCLALAAFWSAGAATAATHNVAIEGMHYVPERLTVRHGDRIVWKNQDLVPHTVTHEAFDSQLIAPDASWSLVARKPGRYLYHCKLHPGMHAVLIVR